MLSAVLVIPAILLMWTSIDLHSRMACGTQVGEAAMLAALRKKMELLVLSLPSGSYAQRVQAEYLKELETRTEAAFKAANA